ncbi:MAG: hypothetical protein CM15mP102_04500 [Flavobacteriales bacterium]|nr:MAG: hypothetical protein CM15mP102_04500 [Flavobacteriales bacterium]
MLFHDFFIFSYEVFLFTLTVRSTTETLAVGILKAMPVSLPFKEGITFVTAFAAPGRTRNYIE